MKRYLSYSIFVALTFFQSCDDVLEEDITDSQITIIAPVNEAMIEGNLVQFRWNVLEGADEYRLQITRENQILVLDSLVANTILNYQMNQGEYQWRIRGENFAYVTPYTFSSDFVVAESLDLTGQTVTLQSPLNNKYFNDPTISFSWQGISTADSYIFQILKKEGVNETLIFEDDNVIETSVTIDNLIITDDAEYIWQVSAKNATSSTSFFRNTFFLDRIVPPAPNLLTPTSGQTFTTSQEVSFTWSFTDSGTVQSNISGTIEIASDENFATIILTNTNVDGQFKNTFSTVGTFYWRVKGEDEAGNVGDYTSTGTFKVN